MDQKPTIRDVANMAGVSVATVSRYFTKRYQVNSETANVIARAVEGLNYHHKMRKGSVGSLKNNTVIIICGDIGSQVYVQYIRGIEDVLNNENYEVLIVDSKYEPDREEHYLQYAIGHKYSGAIMLNVMETASIVRLIKAVSMPIIFVNRFINTLDIDIISMDNYRCGYIATQHLINAGHKNILHLAGPRNSIASSERRRGYIDCLLSNEIVYSEDNIYYGDLYYESGVAFADEIANGTYSATAVYSVNDIMAEAVIDRLIDCGISVPDDISIICTDNTQAAVSGKVKLTCVSYDSFEIGKAAGRMFIDRIKRPESVKKRIMYCPVLTERESVKRVFE